MRPVFFPVCAVVFLSGIFSIAPATCCRASLVTNAPLPISYVLTINPIVVRDNDGNFPATFLGTASQEAEIKGFVDTIWAQAGIDVQWLAPKSLQSTETLTGVGGTNGNNPRPITDLSGDLNEEDHETLGASVRVANAINIFFVDVAAGFPLISPPIGPVSVAGLAELPGDDISLFVGTDLLEDTPTLSSPEFGREAIAIVISHEIGHNLNLKHVGIPATDPEGLMLSSVDPPSARLNAAQISAAIASGTFGGRLLVAVPESSAFLLVGLVASVGLSVRRSRQRRSEA